MELPANWTTEPPAEFPRMMRSWKLADPVCRRLMTVPGVGMVVALTCRTGVDAPERFSKSRDVGAHFGLTPKRYSSGQTDYDGRISRCGDEMVRDVTGGIHDAHVDGFQGHVEADEVLHFPLLGLPYRVPG